MSQKNHKLLRKYFGGKKATRAQKENYYSRSARQKTMARERMLSAVS